MSNAAQIREAYTELHQSKPLIIRSPGRINLIGEHTDYNLGSVLPAAIDKSIFLALGKRQDNEINIYSYDYQDQFTMNIPELSKPVWKLWPNYLLGVINEFKKEDKLLTGFNIVFGGDIPLSVGLSSSAALAVGVALGLNAMFDTGYSKLELAKIAQKAEQEFLKVNCGLMDQFTCLHSKEDNLIKLDCMTNEYEYIPFSSPDIQVVLFDSGIRNQLFLSAYNERREQCEHGLTLVKNNVPEVNTFRDVTVDMLNKYVKPQSEVIYKRCLYVVQEIARLEEACKDLKSEDFEAFGSRMFNTHDGLKFLYEVSCKECDFLVEQAAADMNILGARIMGGGFGGCTINLLYKEHAEETIAKTKTAYLDQYGKELKVYKATLSKGVEILT